MKKVKKNSIVVYLLALSFYTFNANTGNANTGYYGCCVTTTTDCSLGCHDEYFPDAPGGPYWLHYDITEAYEYATCVGGEPGNECWWDYFIVVCKGKTYLLANCRGEIGEFENEKADADWGGDWCWMN